MDVQVSVDFAIILHAILETYLYAIYQSRRSMVKLAQLMLVMRRYIPMAI